MPSDAANFFARVDAGEITAANAADAIAKAGGLAYLILALAAEAL